MKKYYLLLLLCCITVAAQSSTCVVYYSQRGATERLARTVAAEVHCDILSLAVADPYPDTYTATVKRAMEERAAGVLPTLLPLDIAPYDTILLAYPIWFGSCALPIEALIASGRLDGKVIVPFCTFGIGGRDTSFARLAQALPRSTVLPGYGIRNSRVEQCAVEVTPFLKRLALIPGKAAALRAFSTPKPPTAAEEEIYRQAATTYKRSLGTPIAVARRKCQQGTEYRFTVRGENKKGEEVVRDVYVLRDEKRRTAEITFLSRE